MLIGLGHTARVGKDTCANILVEHHGFTAVAFADALREFVYNTNEQVRAIVDHMGWEHGKAGGKNEHRLGSFHIRSACGGLVGKC